MLRSLSLATSLVSARQPGMPSLVNTAATLASSSSSMHAYHTITSFTRTLRSPGATLTQPPAHSASCIRSRCSCCAHIPTRPISTSHRRCDSPIIRAPYPSHVPLSSPAPPSSTPRRSFSTIEAVAPPAGDGTAVQPSDDPRSRFIAVYTCGVCELRSAKSISRQAYTEGVVLLRCDGCEKLHLFADHLGWFDDERIDIETIMKEKGMKVERSSVNISDQQLAMLAKMQQDAHKKSAGNTNTTGETDSTSTSNTSSTANTETTSSTGSTNS